MANTCFRPIKRALVDIFFFLVGGGLPFTASQLAKYYGLEWGCREGVPWHLNDTQAQIQLENERLALSLALSNDGGGGGGSF